MRNCQRPADIGDPGPGAAGRLALIDQDLAEREVALVEDVPAEALVVGNPARLARQ